jgi:ADP-ribosyl-[dinitrogen reductase] hydrolase
VPLSGILSVRFIEFDNYLAKNFQPLFHPEAFFTDDTVCTVAIADALLNEREPAEALRDWCRRYYANGGWGLRFADWILDDTMGLYNSMGNGAAMRVSAAGLLANNIIASHSSR